MQRRYALLAEADDGDGGGDGAPAGGSPKGGQDDLPGDGGTVPKKQFIAALHNATRKTEALEAELAELKAQVKAKPAEAPKRYSRMELNAAVAAGTITQEQADAQIEAQIHGDAETTAQRTALNTITSVERNRHVASEIARYSTIAPEILEEGNDTRARIQQEYTYLTGTLGDRAGADTQLKAIRAVLGPVDQVERSRGGRSQHESHRETGGAGGSAGGGKQKTGKLADQLNAAARSHYEDGIKQGRYKDWAAVEDELKYAKPAVRQRLGIAA